LAGGRCIEAQWSDDWQWQDYYLRLLPKSQPSAPEDSLPAIGKGSLFKLIRQLCRWGFDEGWAVTLGHSIAF